MSGQLSFFSAAAQEPDTGDLAGLLCGPGHCVRRAGRTRISVVVAEQWRADLLLAEMAMRGLDAEVVTARDTDGWSGPAGAAMSVRTAFSGRLDALGLTWGSTGGGKRAPHTLTLDGPMLRLWMTAAGRPWESGYALGLGEHDDASWEAIGAALARCGLPAAFVGPRGLGPAYRLTGARRLSRLAELVGEPVAAVPPGLWPC